MGKSLIIKGENFAANGIAPEFRRLSWIGVTTKDSRDDEEGSTTHGQYINSGAIMTINTKLIVEFTLSTTAYSIMLPGSRYSNPTCLHAWAQPSAFIVYMGYGTSPDVDVMSISANLWDGKKHVVEISKGAVVLDGTTHSWSVTPNNTGQGPSPIYLDCASLAYNPGSSQYANTAAYQTVEGTRVPLPGAAKIHNVKIYSDYTDETSLIVDAIPVKRLSDNVVCFYNAANGEYCERNNGSTPEYGTL